MKRIFSLFIMVGLLFAAESATAQWWTLGLGEPEPPAKTVLPRPVEQAEVDWFSDVAGTSGFTGWIEEVRDGAATALADTATAMRDAVGAVEEQVGEVRDIVSQPPPAIDFAGKTLAREARQAALDYAVAAATSDSTLAPVASRLAARKKLTSAQETLVAKAWLDAIQNGASAGNEAASEVQRLNQVLTDLQREVNGLRAAMIAADTSLTSLWVAHDARLNAVEATLTVAFSPAAPDSASITAVPEEFRQSVLAVRLAMLGKYKKAGKDLKKILPAEEETKNP